MAKLIKLPFKTGNDLRLDFTLTDTNNTVAIAAKGVLDAATLALAEAIAAVPQVPATIAAAEVAVTDAQAAYDAAILMNTLGWGIASQIRWCGRLQDNLTIVRIDDDTAKFAITADSAVTALWKPREYDVDVKFTRVSGKISSETFILDVEQGVTQ